MRKQQPKTGTRSQKQSLAHHPIRAPSCTENGARMEIAMNDQAQPNVQAETPAPNATAAAESVVEAAAILATDATSAVALHADLVDEQGVDGSGVDGQGIDELPLFGQLTPGSGQAQVSNGKDEMNLAEFPIARLGRSDTRLTIEYKGQITDKQGHVIEQKWLVSGNATFGLPTEFADRVLVALMFITGKETGKENLPDRRVPFTIYRILKLLGLSLNQRNYSAVEKALQQLVGVTIYSEGAFWDHQQQKRVTTKKGFHILEEFWLKSFDDDDEQSIPIEENSAITGYVVWGERIWNSFQAGYIKNLDIDFYYSLENTLARRLFRFLDKRMHYQENYQIDIFDLAARLGMKPYPFASHVARKLKPAFDELQGKGFLARIDVIKVGDFTRVRFLRANRPRRIAKPSQASMEGHRDEIEVENIQSGTRELSAPSGGLFEASDQTADQFADRALSQSEQIWADILQEFQRTLPAATYAMLSRSALLHLESGQATVAVDARYQEWIARQLARQIKSLLNRHLEREQRVKEVRLVPHPD